MPGMRVKDRLANRMKQPKGNRTSSICLDLAFRVPCHFCQYTAKTRTGYRTAIIGRGLPLQRSSGFFRITGQGYVSWTRTLSSLLLVLVVCAGIAFAQTSDPLPSWNDGTAKKALTDFVAKVTKEGGPDYVPIPERIAVFDNDGTLWSEQPMYVQMVFAFDRVKALAPQHPDWKEKQPFKAALEGDMKTLLAGGEEALIEVMVAAHAGMTTDEFAVIVKDWLATAKNPKTKRPYTEMVFQPMAELMRTCEQMASRLTLSPAAAASSCGSSANGSMGCHRNR
jgi:hypothetical protein